MKKLKHILKTGTWEKTASSVLCSGLTSSWDNPWSGERERREATRETEDTFWTFATLIGQWGSPSRVPLSLKQQEIQNPLKDGMQSLHRLGFCKIHLSIGAEPNLKFQDIIFEFYSSVSAAAPPPWEKTPNMNNRIKWLLFRGLFTNTPLYHRKNIPRICECFHYVLFEGGKWNKIPIWDIYRSHKNLICSHELL